MKWSYKTLQKQKIIILLISSRRVQIIDFESKTEKSPFYFHLHYLIGAILLASNGWFGYFCRQLIFCTTWNPMLLNQRAVHRKRNAYADKGRLTHSDLMKLGPKYLQISGAKWCTTSLCTIWQAWLITPEKRPDFLNASNVRTRSWILAPGGCEPRANCVLEPINGFSSGYLQQAQNQI